MKKKTKRVKVKKVRIKKPKPDKPVKVKEYGKYKKLKPVTLKPEQMGITFLYEVVKLDKNGEPVITRRAKLNKGKLVKEMYYDLAKDEITNTVGESNSWCD